ncbi:MAG: hypothetical protein K2X48_17905 [Chitinophagaceae bacterium]|nr:hypothetical protein [Chitinophagaceae bacterium]
MESVHIQPFLDQIKRWKGEGLAASQIQTRLEQLQLPQEQLNSIIQEWKRICSRQKRDAGFMWTGIGGTIMLISFMLSMFLFQQNQNFLFVLYTLTFIGIAIVFKGLIDILG